MPGRQRVLGIAGRPWTATLRGGVALTLCCAAWLAAPRTVSAQTSAPGTPGIKEASKLPPPPPAEPPADTASRKLAHDLATKLLKELEPHVDPVVRGAARQYVAAHRADGPPAKVWDDFAVALFLKHDWLAASWCGLNAVTRRWNGQFVTNCAVYLIDLGRADDGLVLLNCAYADGYRSPYLFEALASVYRRRGDKAATSRWIGLAAAAAPDDVNIHVEQSLADTGAPPPSPPPAQHPDPLNQALAELRQHAQRTAKLIQALATKINRVEEDAEAKKSGELFLTLKYQSIAGNASAAEDAIKRARMTPDEYKRTFGGGAFDQAGFDSYIAVMRNQAALSCIENYYFMTETLVRTFSGQNMNEAGWLAVFWADVLYMDPIELEQQMKLGLDSGGGHPPALKSNERAVWGRLDNGPLMHYALAVTQSDDRRRKDLHGCGKLVGDANAACIIRAEKAHCDRVRDAFNAMLREDTDRYDNSAHRFDLVARATMMWGERQLVEYRDYAQRCLKLVKIAKPTASAAEAELRMTQGLLNIWWKTLRDEVVKVDHPTHSLAKFLHEEAERWTSDRQDVMKMLAQMKHDIEAGGGGTFTSTAGCAQVDKKYLELLAQEQWQEYLESLRDNLKDDFQAKYDATIHCEETIGPVSLSQDDTGKFSGTYSLKHALGEGVDQAIEHEVDSLLGKAGGLLGKELELKRTLSLKDMELEGGEVSIASGAAGQGVVAEGEATLFVEKNERTGKWDGGVGVTFKEGLGFKREVSAFGRKFGIGLVCYPGTATAKFYARAAFNDAAALVRASVSGQP
jgi:hypothetical protein